MRCPMRPMLEAPDDYTEVLWWYGKFQDGHLQEDGGMLSQPALMMQMFRAIEGAHAYCQVEKARLAETKARRG